MKSLLVALTRLFPARFRSQFEEDMVEQIEADHAVASERGVGHRWLFLIGTAFDLIRSAAAEHGNPTWVEPRERRNDEGGVGMMMTAWMNDLRLAARSLGRTPGFAVVTVLTLGIALGANASIFSIVNAVLIDPLPFEEQEELVYLAASAPGSDLPDEFNLAVEFFIQWDEEATLLSDLAWYNSFTHTFRTEDRVERIAMSMSSPSLFSTLGVVPEIGRLPRAEDERGVALISHGLWTTWFGADPTVLGTVAQIAGEPREIIGVMPPDFWFPEERVSAWIQNTIQGEITPGRFGMSMVGRTVPGAELAAVGDELRRLALRIPERFGGSPNYARFIEQFRPIVRPLETEFLGATSRPLWLLLGSVAIVLLIACANVANLLGVRAERRQREFAVRTALGAGRSPLVRLQMSEVLIIAGCAGLLAIGIAWVAVPALAASVSGDVPRLASASVAPATLAFTLGAALLSALICGLLPALRAAKPKLSRLREGGRGSTGRAHWARDGLVVGQTALALVLLIGSALLLESFRELRSVDPGYETTDIFTFQIAPEAEHLIDAPSWAAFHDGFMDRLRALPGVESVGIVENVPLNEGVWTARFLTEDDAGGDSGTLVGHTWAAGDYFEAMGIEVLEGRGFVPADHRSELGNALVSKAAADLLWPGQNPLGRLVQREGLDTWETVVGVVEDVRQYDFRDAPDPLVYFPMVGQTPEAAMLTSPGYVVRTARAGEIAPEIRALVREVAPSAPMYRVFTMEELADQSMTRLTFTALTLGLAAGLALLLGSLGLYGVLSFVVAQRTQEIGVRMALGAPASRVRRMVVTQGARMVALGVLIGALAATWATRALGSLLFGVDAVDGGIFVGMSAAMLIVGGLASYLPARRASNVDPIESMRAEV